MPEMPGSPVHLYDPTPRLGATGLDLSQRRASHQRARTLWSSSVRCRASSPRLSRRRCRNTCRGGPALHGLPFDEDVLDRVEQAFIAGGDLANCCSAAINAP
jgi:hypothetical protein